MLNSKYSKVLTIILIIAIVIIVGLLVFIGIDWYKAYTVGKDTQNSLDQFNNNNSNSEGLTYKGFKVAGVIEIPKTKVKYNVLDDPSAKAMEVGITIIYGPGLNQTGNTVLAGHNYRNGTFFSNNNKLSSGDKIYITDLSGKKVTYTIYKKYKTDPNDFSYATRNTNGKREISLTTCTDDSSARIIIWAKED